MWSRNLCGRRGRGYSERPADVGGAFGDLAALEGQGASRGIHAMFPPIRQRAVLDFVRFGDEDLARPLVDRDVFALLRVICDVFVVNDVAPGGVRGPSGGRGDDQRDTGEHIAGFLANFRALGGRLFTKTQGPKTHKLAQTVACSQIDRTGVSRAPARPPPSEGVPRE